MQNWAGGAAFSNEKPGAGALDTAYFKIDFGGDQQYILHDKINLKF